MNVNCFAAVCSVVAGSSLHAQIGGGGGEPPTEYYVFAKDILIKPILPNGAPTTPPDPNNFPPDVMDIRVQYEVFQTHCDEEQFGERELIPSRTFRGRIGPGTDWEETVPTQNVTDLSALVSPTAHTDTVEIDKSPMKLYSKLASETTNWKDEHTFVSDMSSGPTIALHPFEVIWVEQDPVTFQVMKVRYRFQFGFQTPVPEYRAEDLAAGYSYDQQYLYSLYCYSPGTNLLHIQDDFQVSHPWRRGATYLEGEYWRELFKETNDFNRQATFKVYRRSRMPGGDWNDHDNLNHSGVTVTSNPPFTTLCNGAAN